MAFAPEKTPIHGENPETLAARLVTDALVARAEADLRWLDTCEEHLQRRPAPAAATLSNTSTRKASR
jgi:uncharacterized membrane-anchored protein